MELISFFVFLSLILNVCDAVPFVPGARTSQTLPQGNNQTSATTISRSSSSITSKGASQSSASSSAQSISISNSSITNTSSSISNTQSSSASLASSGTSTSTSQVPTQSVALGGNGQPVPTSQPAICSSNAKACWGNYSVETDTEMTWPETGRTVEVCNNEYP